LRRPGVSIKSSKICIFQRLINEKKLCLILQTFIIFAIIFLKLVPVVQLDPQLVPVVTHES